MSSVNRHERILCEFVFLEDWILSQEKLFLRMILCNQVGLEEKIDDVAEREKTGSTCQNYDPSRRSAVKFESPSHGATYPQVVQFELSLLQHWGELTCGIHLQHDGQEGVFLIRSFIILLKYVLSHLSFHLLDKTIKELSDFFTWLDPKDIYLFSWITPLLKNKYLFLKYL